MKRFLPFSLLVTLLFFSSLKLNAQQLPIYNQFKYNQFVFNPALSGVNTDIPVVTLLHRNQWENADGGPETSLVSFNGAQNDRNVGYAAYLYNDVTGIMRTTSFYGNYSYNFKFSDEIKIALGLSLGIVDKGIYEGKINGDLSDPVISNANLNGETVFDFNAGVNFSFYNFDLGFAAPQLFRNSIDYAKEISGDYAVIQLERHYVGSLKYTFNFDIGEMGRFGRDINLSPQIVARYVPGLPVQYDAHLLFDMRYLGWLGAGYRTEMGPLVNVGVDITDDLSVGYAYEFNTFDDLSSFGPTHELALVYRIGGTKRLLDKIDSELEQVRLEDIALMNAMEERLKKRQDSIAEALRNDIVINANKLIDHNETLDSLGASSSSMRSDLIEEDDFSTTASNVVAGSRGFYIVAGVFEFRKNAEVLTAKLAGEGYDVEYFYNRANKYYYVFLRKYKTYEMASRIKNNNINGTYFDELWIKEVK